MSAKPTRIEFSQDEDSDGRTGVDTQSLTVYVADAGGGPYLVIETTRWAIDDLDELADMLRTIQKAAVD